MQLTIALLAAILFSGSVQAQAPSERGRVLLEEFCARCHALGKTGASPHIAAPPFRELGRSFDLDEFTVKLQRGLLASHPDMPEFKFNEEDARAVSAYLRSVQE
ncbi:MAG: cytochrome c [Pseudolabrys sp.]|nr:cytochrome c [Pseudolabrys sp.]